MQEAFQMRLLNNVCSPVLRKFAGLPSQFLCIGCSAGHSGKQRVTEILFNIPRGFIALDCAVVCEFSSRPARSRRMG